MSFMLAMPKISFHGQGAIADAMTYLQQHNLSKALVVTDRDLYRLGLLDPLLEVLAAKEMDYALYHEVMPNPTVAVVDAGYQAFCENGCDYLIAIGGGSAIDAAKGIKILTANPGPITRYSGVGKVEREGALLVAINTTAGTAAEVTSNAVITDPVKQVKEVIIDTRIIADVAVDDPAIMLNIPQSVTAATGMDALTHAIEAYVAKGAHPLTDHSALEAIRLISRYLPQAVMHGDDIEGREMMAFGQYLAGMAFNSAGLGLVHALAHQPGATHDLPHGVCNAILLPVICEFNRPVCVARFARIAQAMGIDTRQMSEEAASIAAIDAIKSLSAKVGIPAGFGLLGVKKSDIDGWINKALADPCAPGNPRTADAKQVEHLYTLAM
ncbi:lactaldehyde reductase [Aeromonas jandaei]|uniref:lactaldehyde reductase n=1 Tax=Aeromonas jandaei TaxID=650 RepID=UPI002AA0E06E|nr:lactaldehyde reductase [Aeromonas jandaei]